MPVPKKWFMCNRDKSCTHSTTHHAEAVYQISDHFHGVLVYENLCVHNTKIQSQKSGQQEVDV